MRGILMIFKPEHEAAQTIARARPRAGRLSRVAFALPLLSAALGLAPLAQADTEVPVQGQASQTEAPGTGVARIGRIELDRETHSFRVPGTVARVEPPLEYLAVARGGMKAYESLLELDAGGVEFNSACILIGLEPPTGGLPQSQFDRQVIVGQAVALSVTWETPSGPKEVPAGRLLTVERKEAGEQPWVYLGSMMGPDGRYLAADTGTLVGFVHDPISVIEHRDGLGIGAYGAIGGNTELVPVPGTRVWLRVTNLKPASKEAPPATD